ncbi:MAG: phospho-N-acetylmuramoyl-pentapeptide-transferase [Clostridia bacterium]|nr:phospho-N-acetylmuramoyl-pentapeptide-transferase [Clostridia bacterium]MBQ7788087.1 phospho-N-acetylmuramoyl-pentapeptide-transferase [Clostridia bacterium]
MYNFYVFIITLFFSLFLTILITKKIIPVLAKNKMGQRILADGPNWHKEKEGTPTMGGVSFVLATIACFFIFCIFLKSDTKEIVILLNVLAYSILNALIGIIDDFAKIRNRRNEGLSAKSKFFLQSIAAILFLISLRITVNINTELYIPFVNVKYDIGIFYYILAYFLLCGFVNAVNLTDGLDGLASSVVLSIGLFFAFVSLSLINNAVLSFISAVLIGGTIGFLRFNLHPAKIFMGDTGSLFLGSMVVSISFVINNILLVLVYGFVFLCEALSDILQVVYFKITNGKRIFKMAPIHHHFEKNGWSEIKIVIIFMLVNFAFCLLSYFGIGTI